MSPPSCPPPPYRVVTPYAPAALPGMPGPFPGRVVSVTAASSIDPQGAIVDEVVREMMDRGMRALTGETTTLAAWRRFFVPEDVVGIKVNAGGVPHVVSSPAVVAEICRRLMEVGVAPTRIVVFERFWNQLAAIGYGPLLPSGVELFAAEAGNRRSQNVAYDPATYVEVDFFGEDDTRSSMMRLVTQRLTKVVNVPNMKDHGAVGATGCLKNVAYGCFSNVARSHARGRTHTRTSVGTFAAVEPLRSRTVLQVMDGLRAVWHGGPFARTTRYVFEPRQDPLRHGPRRDRPPSPRRDRRQAQGRRRRVDLGPLGEDAALRRRHVAGRRPEREHPHPRAWSRRVCGRSRPRRARPRPHPGRGDRGVRATVAVLATAVAALARADDPGALAGARDRAHRRSFVAVEAP